MVDSLLNDSLLVAKKLEIHIDQENRANEPDLTLGHLVELTQSIVNAFSSGQNHIAFPSTNSLLLLDGDSQNLRVSGKSLAFIIDQLKKQSQNNEELRGHLFPDDVASILSSIRAWTNTKYSKSGQSSLDWGPEISGVIEEINRYQQNDLSSLKKVVMEGLKIAAKKTLERLEAVYKQYHDSASVKLEPAQPVIDRIEEDFKIAQTATDYQQVWISLGLELANGLADHNLETSIVEDKKNNRHFSISDAKKIINAFYEQIRAQYDKREENIDPLWKKVTSKTREKFDPRQSLFFSIDEINKVEINDYDRHKAKEFIENITTLFEELKKDTPGTGAGGNEDDGKDEDVGGEDQTEPHDKTATPYTQADLSQKVLKQLKTDLEERFWEFFKTDSTSLDQLEEYQKDWLTTQLPLTINTLLNKDDIRSRVTESIIKWLEQFPPESKTATKTDSGGETDSKADSDDQYLISEDQIKTFSQELATWFLTDQAQAFISLIDQATAIIKKSQEPVQPDSPDKTATVPPSDRIGDTGEADIAPTDKSKPDLDKSRQARDLVTQFLIAQFGEQDEALTKLAFDLVLADTASQNLTKEQVWQKLLLNREFFDQAQKTYSQKLAQLGFATTLDINKVYMVIDTILVLSPDPEKYFNNLSETELKAFFGLTDSNIDIEQFKPLLRSLISIRRFAGGSKITPWFSTDNEDSETTSAIKGVGEFIRLYGENGVAALNLTPEEIDSSQTIADHRKEIIKQLYKELWLASVAGKSEKELTAIYIEYGVDIIDIDYSAPPPGFGTFSQAAQQVIAQANNGEKDGDGSGAQKLFAKGKQKLGKAVLSAVAPELAPILAALENVPILGDMAKDVEEKTGKLLLMTLGAGVAGLAGLVSRGVGTILGTIGGGLIGLALGGVGGMVIGAGLGGWLGGGGYKSVGNWLKNLGKSKSLGTGLGTRATVNAGLSSAGNSMVNAAQKTAATSFKIAGTTVVGGTIITITAVAGTQLHPVPSKPDNYPNAQQNISRYVTVNKNSSMTKLENNQLATITYTIDITPKDNYIIQINAQATKDEWSYLGGDELSLPDQTPIILEQIPSDPITSEQSLAISYEVKMKGVDVAVNNNFTLVFDVINKTGDVIASDEVASFATVLIGNPEIGCLVPGEAGSTYGSGDSRRTSLEWNPNDWGRILRLFANHAGKSTYLNNLLCQNGPVIIYRFEDNKNYGGWFLELDPNPKIAIYNYALGFSAPEFEYTLVHELGHAIDNLQPGIRGDLFYLYGEQNNCFGYPGGGCNEFESFAEAFTLYVAKPSNHRGLETYDPGAYEWFKENVFKGEEF